MIVGMKTSELEDQLEQENAALKRELAAKEEKIQELERQLDLAEHRNSHGFSGGESFLDTCASSHLLRMNNVDKKSSELENQLEQENAALKRELAAKEEEIQKLESQLDTAGMKSSELEDQLEQENAALKRELAAKEEEIHELERQLDLAEHRNSHDFSGGESFQDTCASPHLLRMNNVDKKSSELENQPEQEIANVDKKSSELENQPEQEIAALKREVAALKRELAAQEEEIRKLERQLDLAELWNSHDFSGGESFQDTCATPHLLRMNNVDKKSSELENQLEQENAALKRELAAKEEIQKLERQLDTAGIEDQLEQENAALKRELAAKEEKIHELERQLDLAEHRNSHGFSGGESFQDTCATPHLLRINNLDMKSSEMENQLEQENAALKRELAAKEEEIQKLESQLDTAGMKSSELEDQLEQENAALKRELAAKEEIQTLERQLDTCATPDLLRTSNVGMESSELEDQLEQENSALKRELAAKEEEIQKLENQLDLAEHRNSHDFSGGESFLDTCATPHLLNKAVERVYSISSSFTKLLMHALQHHGGVDCPNVAQAQAKSVTFERVAHTKFVYQALACKVLFTDFENEYFNVDENAPEYVLDPEQLTKENFQRYTELIALENPEELVFEDATDNDFRRLCNKKHQDLVVALSNTLAPGVANVGALLFGNVYGPKGIRRSSWTSAEAQYQIKIASTFIKFVLSVFLVHKLALALRPIARIFRVREGVEFSPTHMEAVVALADCEDDDVTLVPLSAALTIVPGFQVNRIIVHSRVYTVKRL